MEGSSKVKNFLGKNSEPFFCVQKNDKEGMRNMREMGNQLCLVEVGTLQREDRKNLIKERMEEGYGVESLMNFENLSLLTNIKVDELQKFKTLAELEERLPMVNCTENQRMKLKIFFTMARRYFKEERGQAPIIKSPEDVYRLVGDDMKNLKKEVFKIIMLDTKNNVIGIKDISIGSLNSSICHPREIFKEAIINSCSGIILSHNHPSQNCEPSKEDCETTKRLVEVGDIVGIKVLDHVIVGGSRYLSFKEQGLM